MLKVFFPRRRTQGVAFSVNDEEKFTFTCPFLNSALILLKKERGNVVEGAVTRVQTLLQFVLHC